MSNRKKIIYTFISGLLLLITLELLLTILTACFSSVAALTLPPPSPIVQDDRLQHRPNPAHPEHDSRGFRNSVERQQTRILAQGDSQTYGAGVRPEEAWPSVLEQLTRQSVYNMGYGGYSSVHHLVLWEEAMELSPEIIVHTIYSGNDLYDAFSLVYHHDQFPKLKEDSLTIRQSIERLEKEDPIAEQITQLFSNLHAQDPTEGRSLRYYLSNYSKLYGLLRSVRHTLAQQANRSPDLEAEWQTALTYAQQHPSDCERFEAGRFRTLFTADYRKTAMDIRDPRIMEGLRIIVRVIEEMKQRAEQKGIQFIVLGIPTKEFAFRGLVDQASASYQELVGVEEEVWREIRKEMDRIGVDFIDSWSALQACFEEGQQPFFQSADGHLNNIGHRAVAKDIHQLIE